MADAALLDRIDAVDPFPAYGYVTRVASGHVEADGPLAALGTLCHIVLSDGRRAMAEVSAISTELVTLVPLDTVIDAKPGHCVIALPTHAAMRVGDGFAGRAIDALGRPLDGHAAITRAESHPANHCISRIFDRVSPSQILETGLRAIDGLLTIGVGQRVGIFAASGVGKTRLIDQLSHHIDCDHVVICQVGERGREVEKLWSDLQKGSRADRVSLVAATSDESAPMRVRAVEQALVIAEYWRSVGRHVLLIVDSVTRLAMALREIGLASGEPPTVRAYTPNVLKALPSLVERCGALRSGGAITAIFTVLAETDDIDDPIVEVMKSLLDGHILLSRTLAQLGHYPAIDVARSISRLAADLAVPDHRAAATRALALLGRYEESRVLIESGLYAAGSDRAIDAAIAARPALLEFLKQRSDQRTPFDKTVASLSRLVPHG